MKPIIGIIGSEENERFTLACGYMRSIEDAGCSAVYLIGSLDESILQKMDGFVLTSGGYIDPIHFGEAPLPGLGEINGSRDIRELALLRKLTQVRKPCTRDLQGYANVERRVWWNDSPRPLFDCRWVIPPT